MDVGFFLKQRTAFIRQFYDNASFSFVERKRKIEAGEDPFIPPYSESEEPPFLEEWIEADDSLHVLGYTCISMLSAALHLYLRTWETIQFRIPVDDSLMPEFKKKGWINGYKMYFSKNFDIHFEQAPVNMALLEEIVLARNRVQHPEYITKLRPSYLPKDKNIAKAHHLFFIDDVEMKLLGSIEESESGWLFPPSIHITKEKLHGAILEVEKFSDWLEEQINANVYRL